MRLPISCHNNLCVLRTHRLASQSLEILDKLRINEAALLLHRAVFVLLRHSRIVIQAALRVHCWNAAALAVLLLVFFNGHRPKAN